VSQHDIRRRIQRIPLHLIDPDPNQPRKTFDPGKLGELQASLRSQGLLQPISVRKTGQRYMLIAGERRFRSAQAIGWDTIPAQVLDLAELDAVKHQLLENIVRADLDPVEEAQAYRRLLDGGMTPQEIAETVGTTPGQITWKVNILRAPDDVLHLVARGQCTPTLAWHIGRLTPENQYRARQFMTRAERPEMVVAMCEQLFGAQAQGEMFAETKLTEQQMEAGRVFKTALDRAIDAVNYLVRYNQQHGYVVAQAVAAEAEVNLAKVRELKKALGDVERSLMTEQAKMSFLQGEQQSAPLALSLVV